MGPCENENGTESRFAGTARQGLGFKSQTTVEAKMADRDVYGERIHRDRLPSGMRPIFGILLAVLVIAAWVLLAVVFDRDGTTHTANLESPNSQAPSSH